MKFRKSKEQAGLFDFIEREQELSKRVGSLDKLNELIDFEVFRADLLEILDYGEHAQGGRPPWDPVLMLKALIIQRYYNLSEEETEFQIPDRFSFQRFLGLSVGDAVPDKNTIRDFKQRLGRQGMKRLFDLFGNLLAEQGLVGKGGKIVDASFVDVSPGGVSEKTSARAFRRKPAVMWTRTPAGPKSATRGILATKTTPSATRLRSWWRPTR